ncbi:MAG: potassium channel family protein [Sphingobacterium sp.]|uniref:potassium channel family protein n=1 Tax=Sphingobacterium sp. JB170 TaxID=1434842 RepID=UPI00097EB41E|nr:TrkA family potassium uptake protein [Sphingobacterium sp. JB170]SJN20776.1 Trk system potassium uptake protein TrkA [Sphingobacterium sp. JB170]
MKYIVLGLGHFGRSLAIHLTELGHEVIAVDKNLSLVEQLKDKITHTVCMDSTDREAMTSLPLKDSDAVIVAIGEDEGASLLSTALIKELQVKRIIGRVVSDLQKAVLQAMQIDEYIMPEEETAERLALRLDNIDIIDSFKISDRYSIIETKVPTRYVGMTLEEADLTNQFKVIVLTTVQNITTVVKGKNVESKEASGIAKRGTLLKEEDMLVLFGEMSDIKRMLEKSD